MIEINTKAKPFNPCESIVGTEMLFEFLRTRLIGPHYYIVGEQIKDRGREMIAMPKTGHFSSTMKRLRNVGWEEFVVPNLPVAYYPFRKQVVLPNGEAGHDRLVLTSEITRYLDWLHACEVCKYLPLKYNEDSLTTAKHIHSMIINDMIVNLNAEGDFMGLKPFEDNAVEENWNNHAPIPNNIWVNVQAQPAQWGGQFAQAEQQVAAAAVNQQAVDQLFGHNLGENNDQNQAGEANE